MTETFGYRFEFHLHLSTFSYKESVKVAIYTMPRERSNKRLWGHAPKKICLYVERSRHSEELLCEKVPLNVSFCPTVITNCLDPRENDERHGTGLASSRFSRAGDGSIGYGIHFVYGASCPWRHTDVWRLTSTMQASTTNDVHHIFREKKEKMLSSGPSPNPNTVCNTKP